MRLRDATRIAARLQLAMAEARAAEELGILLLERGRQSDAIGAFERASSRYAAMEASGDVARVTARLDGRGEQQPRGASKRRATE
jgi:hypothetical protein